MHINELRGNTGGPLTQQIDDGDGGAGVSNSSGTNGEDQSNYLMMISSITNGRLTSDISFSFKVPPPVQHNTLLELEADMEDYLQHQQQNVSISRLKKISPNDSHEQKRTNAESFTTAATIRQLPLIWTIFVLIVFVLIVLILIVLGKLYVNKRRRKPHVHFSELNSVTDAKYSLTKLR